MTLRNRKYLLEDIQKKFWMGEDKDLWGEYGGRNEGMDRFLTAMGFNPNVSDLIEKKQCPKCGERKLSIKERHPDTGMDCMVSSCSNCKYEKEL